MDRLNVARKRSIGCMDTSLANPVGKSPKVEEDVSPHDSPLKFGQVEEDFDASNTFHSNGGRPEGEQIGHLRPNHGCPSRVEDIHTGGETSSEGSTHDDDSAGSEPGVNGGRGIGGEEQGRSLSQHSQDERMDGLDHHILMQKMKGADPAILLKDVADQLGISLNLPANLPQEVQWSLLRRIMLKPLLKFRKKLDHINVLDDVVNLIQRSKRIMVLTGAGISVACGIPDFRSENGIYARLGQYNLPDPQCMFDINFFRRNPFPFFTFSRELLPGTYRPSVSHLFIRHLEHQNRLLRCYTQNIDSLELVAGLPNDRLLQCHGSFETATCLFCKSRYLLEEIREQIEAQEVPMCEHCGHPEGIIKPDIVFFGETLGDRFPKMIEHDKRRVDLLIVMGSSLKVGPVNKIMQWLPERIPQILINRELVGQPNKFDVELLGNCDAIVLELCRRLGWALPVGEAVNGGIVPERVDEEGQKMEEDFEFEAPNRYYFVAANKPCEEGGNRGSDDEEEGEVEDEGVVGEEGYDEEEEDGEEGEAMIERALLKPTLLVGGEGGAMEAAATAAAADEGGLMMMNMKTSFSAAATAFVVSGAGDGASGASSSGDSSRDGFEDDEDEEVEEGEEEGLPGIDVVDEEEEGEGEEMQQQQSLSQHTDGPIMLYPPLVSPIGCATTAPAIGMIASSSLSQSSTTTTTITSNSNSRPSSALAFSPHWGSQSTPGLGPKPTGVFPLEILELP